MYEVFFNERKIIIASEGKEGNTSCISFPLKLDNQSDLKAWFLDFVSGNRKEVVLIQENCDEFFARFQEAFKQLPAAGGIVKRKNQFLFIFRNGKWDLPKGKIDDGENSSQAAIREVEEECGISGHRIVGELPPTYHIYQSVFKKNEGEWIFKKTSWFIMEYSGIRNGIPEKDEGIEMLRWFKREELGQVWENTYENLKNGIRPYL